jgi:hypothetical protein
LEASATPDITLPWSVLIAIEWLHYGLVGLLVGVPIGFAINMTRRLLG